MLRTVALLLILATGMLAKAQNEKNKLSVFIFLSPECPLSQNYTRTLNILNKEYSKTVKFIGVIAGRTYTSTEIAHYIKDYKINFEVLTDTSLTLAKEMHATVTPEALLVDSQKNILYRGAIDDWAISPGKKKLSPTNSYLKNAIQQVLNGEEVTIRETKPVGCYINEY